MDGGFERVGKKLGEGVGSVDMDGGFERDTVGKKLGEGDSSVDINGGFEGVTVGLGVEG
eukprot:CAMPEP_0178958286 /NCGR_PEP_ID=MMETSP0789-20121207/11520_1 /TAXON_ID=3005 /ORGANISM="Rhizosolenia setigera, Strain CCMP 1694" /LENGTH=58 /DNA_ID=CAMNT_0020640899 /DNA_START=854 /DNA_END=1030 /DNA_ORIENTATION=+